MEINVNGIEEFKESIVDQTSVDYLKAHRRLHKIDNYGHVCKECGKPIRRETIVDELEEIMEFLYSDWFRVAVGVNPNRLLDILDKMFEEWKTEYDRKMKEGG